MTLPDPFTKASVDAMLEEAQTRWSDGTCAELAIVLGGRLAGAAASCSRRLAGERRLLGRAGSTGAGRRDRAVRLMTRWAFETFEGLVRTSSGARRERAVGRGCPPSGVVEEGVFRSRLPFRSEYRDVRCFSLVRGE